MENNCKKFMDAFEALREKHEYERALRFYHQRQKEMNALQRLFARPSDPFPGMTVYEMDIVLQDLFTDAYPELNGYAPGADGPDSYMVKTILYYTDGKPSLLFNISSKACTFSSESFEYDAGEGFVHAYNRHPADGSGPAARRSAAKRAAMERRYTDRDADRIYYVLDFFCTAKAKEVMEGSYAINRRAVRSMLASEYVKHVQGTRTAPAVHQRADVTPVAGLEDYRMRMKELLDITARARREKGCPAQVLEYYQQQERMCDEFRSDRMADCIADEVREGSKVSFRHVKEGVEDWMRLSGVGETAAAELFCSIAREAGFPKDRITECLEKDFGVGNALEYGRYIELLDSRRIRAYDDVLKQRIHEGRGFPDEWPGRGDAAASLKILADKVNLLEVCSAAVWAGTGAGVRQMAEVCVDHVCGRSLNVGSRVLLDIVERVSTDLTGMDTVARTARVRDEVASALGRWFVASDKAAEKVYGRDTDLAGAAVHLAEGSGADSTYTLGAFLLDSYERGARFGSGIPLSGSFDACTVGDADVLRERYRDVIVKASRKRTAEQRAHEEKKEAKTGIRM